MQALNSVDEAYEEGAVKGPGHSLLPRESLGSGSEIPEVIKARIEANPRLNLHDTRKKSQ